MDSKRLLVISNEAMCSSDSNGRTLKNYLINWNKNKIAQLFVRGAPDFDICDNYYQISDRDALNSLLKLKPHGRRVLPGDVKGSASSGVSSIKKSPVKLIAREIVWKTGAWKGNDLKKWISEFSPEIILLFLGNCIFLIEAAMEISEKFHIPIVVFTGENYYFKNFNYITKKHSAAYIIYRHMFRSRVKRLAGDAKKFILNTKGLKVLYQREFPDTPCTYIMPNSALSFICSSAPSQEITVSYLGNLGIGRHEPLIEIADALQNIDPNIFLDIYGKITDEKVKRELIEARGVRYNGVIPYSEVISVIRKSVLLIHVESFSDYYIKDLKYAFSAKLADSISSGTLLFCYASNKLICTEFLIENKCAVVAVSKDELEYRLRLALFDAKTRSECLVGAMETSRRYFSATQNSDIFCGYLLGKEDKQHSDRYI